MHYFVFTLPLRYFAMIVYCMVWCLSSPLDAKVLLHISHEKLADTPGIDSSDSLLREAPIAVPPLEESPCISFLCGIHREHNP